MTLFLAASYIYSSLVELVQSRKTSKGNGATPYVTSVFCTTFAVTENSDFSVVVSATDDTGVDSWM